MASNTYAIEYAKTGRSGCKEAGCKKSGENKIDAGELRIAKVSPNPFSDGDMKTDWYHPKCWFVTQGRMKAGSKKIESTDDVDGYDKLKSGDQQLIKDLIAGKSGGGGGGKKKKAAKKRKGSDDDDEDDDEGSDDDKKKKKKKAAPKKKKAKGSDDDGSDEDEKPKKKKAKVEKKKKAKGSDDDGSDDEKPKKKKGGGGGGGGKKQRYEVDEKFWEVTVDGDSMTVTFGKIGSNGQTQNKSFANNAAAQKEADKLIRQKTGKGYELQD